ncbi:hypothetical protein F2P79_011251 [Pimephales promelas]|nr:hypothetical protein F2P79_011251 [Pimephales promelas]
MTAMLSRAAASIGLEWNPLPCPVRSLLDDWFLGAAAAAKPQPTPIPFFLELHEELAKAWKAPLTSRERSKLSIILPVVDQILMTLMKLKLNLILGDIAHRFNVSTSMASIVISHWIDVMGEQFKVLIPWLPRETIRATMPLSFQRNYPRTTCIIDCAESAMQRATNHDSRSDTFSQYKSHNTVKYLVAVAPNGLIMFISDAYAGRSSDKFITMDSGFLDYLRAGDEVMADRGFTIRDLLDERKVSLNIPAFTYRRNQLTNEETTRTRRVANVRIHVERAIQRLKVLSQTVPISMAPKLDNILTICAGLVNLKSPLIRVPCEV